LEILQNEPVTKVGDCRSRSPASCITDMKKNLIVLNPVIVRYKNLPAPKPTRAAGGTRSSAVVYSFTGGRSSQRVGARQGFGGA